MPQIPPPVRNAPDNGCFVCRTTALSRLQRCAGGCGLCCHMACEGQRPVPAGRKRPREPKHEDSAFSPSPPGASADAAAPSPPTPASKSANKAPAAREEKKPPPAPTTWNCPRCTLINVAGAKKCKVCEKPNPNKPAAAPKAPPPPKPPPKPRPPPKPKAFSEDEIETQVLLAVAVELDEEPAGAGASSWQCDRCATIVGAKVFARSEGTEGGGFFWPGRVLRRDTHGQILVQWEAREEESEPRREEAAPRDMGSSASTSPASGSGDAVLRPEEWISERHAALAHLPSASSEARRGKRALAIWIDGHGYGCEILGSAVRGHIAVQFEDGSQHDIPASDVRALLDEPLFASATSLASINSRPRLLEGAQTPASLSQVGRPRTPPPARDPRHRASPPRRPRPIPRCPP